MGIIQKQSMRSTAVILVGFAIGAFNMLVLSPKILTAEQLGLTRVITDAGLTLATMCTLGVLPVIYKFFPFYKSHLSTDKNDLPFLTGFICLAGFAIMCLAGWLARDVIIRKFTERSPLFVEYSSLVYPYCFFILTYMWLECFAWSFRKSTLSNGLRELLPRILFTVILVLFAYGILNLKLFVGIFSLSYLIPAIVLFIALRNTRQFLFNTQISPVTHRLGGKMANFGMFIFGSQFLNLLSRTIDTFILSAKSERGLTDTAVFTIATYVVTLMEVPQRSMNAVTIPVLADAWKSKDRLRILNIYKKSVSNLLVIGLLMFALMWLNIHNLASFLGKDFKGIEWVILFMGIGKLIDLGTGANSQIIGTSSYWKVDFFTNVIYTLVALPLNYFLIAHFGLMGAAYSTLISLTIYNLLRFGFLWYKFKMQPYTFKHLLVIIWIVLITFCVHLIPKMESIYIDSTVRTVLFCFAFVPVIYLTRISSEINELIRKYALQVNIRL